MSKKGLTVLYWFILLILSGCYSNTVEHFPAEQPIEFKAKKIIAITLKNGQRIQFNEKGGRYIEDSNSVTIIRRIVGVDNNFTLQNNELSSIYEVETISMSWNGLATGIYIAGVAVALFLLIIFFTPIPPVG